MDYKLRRGIFITFEGPEGAGKSTHSRALSRWIKKKRFPVLLTREPGGTVLGQRLRTILLDHRSKIDSLTELFLYEAARAALVSHVIRPALDSGRVVLVDRFQDSTWVYQSWAGGLPVRLVEQAGRAATGGLMPDLTILLDLPAERGLARVKRPNRMEGKNISFHRKVRQGYLVLARRNPGRFRVVRADQPVVKSQLQIREIVTHVLEKYRRA